MDCINIICLYLKKYVSDKEFENIFYEYISDFQSSLEEDRYLNILSTNFNSKEEKISLETELHNYILNNYKLLYENINDAYVERMISLNKEDAVVKILKKKYKKKKEIFIDCSTICTQLDLIFVVKKALQYPQFCGNNWDAIEDLIYDVIFPEKLIFSNWYKAEKRLPSDTTKLRDILDRNNNGRCVIIFA